MTTGGDLEGLFEKIFEKIDSLYRSGLSVAAMENEADIRRKLAEIEGTKGVLREQASKLLSAIATIEEAEALLRSALPGQPMSLNAVPEARAESPPDPPATPPARSPETGHPRYFECSECHFFHPEGFNGLCGDDNTFDEQKLDERHGEDGWDDIPQNEQHGRPKLILPDVEAVLRNLPNLQRRAKKLGLHPGSKKYRIYEATKALLKQQGSMHIRDIFDSISELGVFEDVSDRQGNLSNVLSQLKSKGLLTCDTRGNWSLPRITE